MQSLLLIVFAAGFALAAESPEFVRIFSINGKEVPNHPPVIDVLPGEQVAFRVDVLQFGEACPHPEGCPEGRNAEEFKWSADGGVGGFEAQGTETIFHIPATMGNELRIAVSHGSLSSSDSIVLRNAQFEPPPPRDPHYVYFHDPYWCPYYPYTSCYAEPPFAVGIAFFPYGYHYYGPPYWYHSHWYRPYWHNYAYWHHPHYVAPRPIAVRPARPYFAPAPTSRFRAPRFHRRRR